MDEWFSYTWDQTESAMPPVFWGHAPMLGVYKGWVYCGLWRIFNELTLWAQQCAKAPGTELTTLASPCSAKPIEFSFHRDSLFSSTFSATIPTKYGNVRFTMQSPGGSRLYDVDGVPDAVCELLKNGKAVVAALHNPVSAPDNPPMPDMAKYAADMLMELDPAVYKVAVGRQKSNWVMEEEDKKRNGKSK